MRAPAPRAGWAGVRASARVQPNRSRLMICRIWHGWTTQEDASRYESLLRGEVIPEIESRRIPGFRAIDLMRRTDPGGGVEFSTIMWFDDLDAVRAFVGEDYEVAHVPERARSVLLRFDERSAHYEVLDRREQPVRRG
jgi:heme-degrading monooxygenase HmoA